MELKDNSVELTEEGIALAEWALQTKDLWDEKDPWARFNKILYLVSFSLFLQSKAFILNSTKIIT